MGARPRLALSFDDGPHPGYTPPLLGLLEELNLRATFFVVGRNAEENSDLVRRMATAGHEVANHTYSHSEPRATSVKTFLDEIQRTDRLVQELTGRIPFSVRPPKGELNWGKLFGLWRRDRTVVLWNVDPRDYRMSCPDEMTNWCHAYEPQDGDIVLLHDTFPCAIHAVRTMASRGIFERFEATTIGEFASRGNPPITSIAGA